MNKTPRQIDDHPILRPWAGRGGRRAFTLLELIIATVMLTILSGMIVLRATSNVPRRARIVVGQVELLLESLAHRQMVSQTRLALVFDKPTNTLTLQTLRREVDENDDDLERAFWKRDPLTPQIIFDDTVQLSFIQLDGNVNAESFRYEFPLDEVRPLIEVGVQFGEQSAIVILLPQSSQTERIGFGATAAMLPKSLDLDEAGLGEEEW